MAGRFPSASNLDEYWNNLQAGKECISVFSRKELLRGGVPEHDLLNSDYVPARGIIGDADYFDAEFFGIPPREAELIDPQNRVLLECAQTALENSGHRPQAFQGLIGVYAGKSISQYLLRVVSAGPESFGNPDLTQLFLGNDKDFLPSQISYKLNLHGPSVNVQTACSTSLAAVHLACQGLLSGECDIALAGGVSIQFPEERGYLYRQGGITSPDGHCRSFDALAQGTVPGNGAGVVVLRRLTDALASQDSIRAVIKGSAMNSDGARKLGYSAPSVEGQAEVLRAAYTAASVDPSDVSYIEAHGTGTALGDLVEITALNEVFCGPQRKKICRLGSVKGNIGHLDAAAGISGLIKTVLALEHRQIPPTPHFQSPHPEIPFSQDVFEINKSLVDWSWSDSPRCAGVSSFGIGGTNVHVVLEEAPPQSPRDALSGHRLFLLSAKSEEGLRDLIADSAHFWRSHTEQEASDIAFTLQAGRDHLRYRYACVAETTGEAADALDRELAAGNSYRPTASSRARIVFMFPGQGSQFENMGYGLYKSEKVFRNNLNECAELLRASHGFDLIPLLYSRFSPAPLADDGLRETWIAQPALFAIEYSLAKLWMSWGMLPDAMIGHSLGEYVAACLSGVLRLEDALTLVGHRGRMMQNTASGAMLAVALSEPDVGRYLSDQLSLAAINGPDVTVVSGSSAAIKELEPLLASRGIWYRRLNTSHAFHSSLVDTVLPQFVGYASSISFNPPQIPYVSCLTGRWIKPEESTDPAYWAKHFRETVRFMEGLTTVLEEPHSTVLEVGPGKVLANLATQLLRRKELTETTIFGGLTPAGASCLDHQSLLQTLGGLWARGAGPDWEQFNTDTKARRVPQPTYPFQRRLFSLFTDSAIGSHKKPDVGNLAPEAKHGGSSLRSYHPRPVLAPSYEAPLGAIESALAAIWESLLGIAPIGRQDHFFELGGTSLSALELISEVRRRLPGTLLLGDVAESPLLSKMASRLSTPAHESPVRLPLVSIHTGGKHRPLFCVHPIGGTVLCYRELAACLGQDQPLFAFQSESVSSEQTIATSIVQMATDYVASLRTFQPHPPYRLGGWSLGGTIAVEMARQLRHQGAYVDMLFAVDSHPSVTQGANLSEFEETLNQMLKDKLNPLDVAAKASMTERIHQYLARTGATDGTSIDLDSDDVRRLIETYRNNLWALRCHSPEPYAGDLTLFRASRQEDGAADDLGWRSVIQGKLEILNVEGDHYSIMRSPALNEIARRLRIEMEGGTNQSGTALRWSSETAVV